MNDLKHVLIIPDGNRRYAKQKGIDTKRGYGTGPSRKFKLISNACRQLKLPLFTFHNIRRGCYFFAQAKNFQNVIHDKKKPIWYNRPFEDLTYYWLERWGIPRSNRTEEWKNFDKEKYLKKTELQIKRL